MGSVQEIDEKQVVAVVQSVLEGAPRLLAFHVVARANKAK
jgi:hypothetical protein